MSPEMAFLIYLVIMMRAVNDGQFICSNTENIPFHRREMRRTWSTLPGRQRVCIVQTVTLACFFYHGLGERIVVGETIERCEHDAEMRGAMIDTVAPPAGQQEDQHARRASVRERARRT
jgi:hypothetical protein